eukprot:226347-Chlamydomonas_euryale.AAC.2
MSTLGIPHWMPTPAARASSRARRPMPMAASSTWPGASRSTPAACWLSRRRTWWHKRARQWQTQRCAPRALFPLISLLFPSSLSSNVLGRARVRASAHIHPHAVAAATATTF